jgi:DNA-binding NarL/FixJ family response regulator
MAKKTRKPRVLLADDHELVRRGIRGLLNTKRSWTIVGEAADGAEAVEKARKLNPDIVILDIDMPNVNGLEATPRIRAAAPNAKIVMLTLHESGEMVRRALETGAQGFVLKSDLAEGLVTALKEVSQPKPFLTPKVSNLVMREFLSTDAAQKPEMNPKAAPTSREAEVIRLLADGKTNKEVGTALGITVRTAEAHRANIMRRLGLHSLAELVHYAIRNGLVGRPLTEAAMREKKERDSSHA